MLQQPTAKNSIDYSTLKQVPTIKEALNSYYVNQKYVNATTTKLIATISIFIGTGFTLLLLYFLAYGLYTIAFLSIAISLAVSVFIFVATYNRGTKMLRLRNFASKNGFSYSASAVSNERGLFADAGSDACYIDRLTVRPNGNEVFISNYRYKPNSNNKKVDIVGIVEIKMPKTLPNIFLNSSKNYTPNTATIVRQIKGAQKYSLEGDFNKFFTLYAPANYQRDTLYFLTPELMALLVDEATDYDIEIIDNTLKLYKPGGFDYSEHTVKTLFALIDSVGGEFIENTARYIDEKSSNIALVATGGKRLLQTHWQRKVLAIIVVMIVITWVWSFLNFSLQVMSP